LGAWRRAKAALADLEAVFRRPQTQAGAPDKIYFSARDCVPALSQSGGNVAFQHVVEVSVFEARALHFFTRQMSWTPDNPESAFGRAMNQVRCGA
jgi:hypothetical protein